MFSDTYFPYISGVVRSIERLSAALRSRGHTVTIFGPHYRGYTDEIDAGVVRCPSLPLYPPANIVLALPRPAAIRRVLQTRGVDVIHSHSPFIMGKTAVALGRELELPVVFTHHSVYHEYAVYAPKPLRRRAEKAIINWLGNYMRSVDAVIAPSPGTRRFIAETYGLDATVISNPIEAPATEPAAVGADAAATGAATSSEPALVFVGRLGKEKNLSLLLHAFALVLRQCRARLVLVGDGPDRENILRLADELGIRSSMHITGFLSYAGVSEQLARATLFVFPSFNETQGMVILEALAHGVPVVAVESEASHAVIDMCRCGKLTAARPQDMAEAICDMLSHPQQLQAFGAAGRQFAQRFSAAGVATEMEHLYESLLKTK